MFRSCLLDNVWSWLKRVQDYVWNMFWQLNFMLGNTYQTLVTKCSSDVFSIYYAFLRDHFVNMFEHVYTMFTRRNRELSENVWSCLKYVQDYVWDMFWQWRSTDGQNMFGYVLTMVPYTDYVFNMFNHILHMVGICLKHHQDHVWNTI